MEQFYHELAEWWPLISPIEDYAEEAAFFSTLFAPVAAQSHAHLLELGCGGGSNAFHMKAAFSAVTLSDMSPAMLAISQRLNPDCVHIDGDMRTLRLNKTFDAVFIHDAIGYMTTLEDLRRAFETAYVHCRAGGMAVFVPDCVRETFRAEIDEGGGEGYDRAVRFISWDADIDNTASVYITDYVFVLRVKGQPLSIVHEQHVQGLFSRAEWLALLADVGFHAQIVIDSYEREVFVATKPASASCSET